MYYEVRFEGERAVSSLKSELFVSQKWLSFYLNHHGNLCRTHNLVGSSIFSEFRFKLSWKCHIFTGPFIHSVL